MAGQAELIEMRKAAAMEARPGKKKRYDIIVRTVKDTILETSTTNMRHYYE